MTHGQQILFPQKMLLKGTSRLVFAPFPCFSSHLHQNQIFLWKGGKSKEYPPSDFLVVVVIFCLFVFIVI